MIDTGRTEFGCRTSGHAAAPRPWNNSRASSARRTGRAEEARTILKSAVAQLPAELLPRLRLIIQPALGVLEEDPVQA
ncbi:hypothetical protein [Streptomyces sp. NPDC058394]|uniref:hypothetical protein n=1 Tax=Streptomyces sp. NPDC058394 TaxID=3346477 RepID=UPI003668BAB5